MKQNKKEEKIAIETVDDLFNFANDIKNKINQILTNHQS